MKDFAFELLDWCGEHEALLIAVAGFISSVAIAKITGGLELRRALCVRRFEVYEQAIGQLSLKLNVYYNIQAALESLKDKDSTFVVLKSKIAILLSSLQKLGEVEKEDFKVTVVALYTVLPNCDTKPLVKELAYLLSRIQEFSCLVNMPSSQAQINQFVTKIQEDVERIAPMVEKETNHLNAIYAQLKDEISKDKMVKKFFRKS